ncbi:MAG: hypothetical protein RMJ87_00445 [Cytophagales bacterium]|nr:hypothetical protein [Bernardetiaceae bacterium]MDW8203469.1 hypothetical protein [Cytophagales bacterium]
MKNLFLVPAILVLFHLAACNSQEKQLEIDRQVRKKLAILGGSVVKELKLNPENQKNLYFAEAIMENGLPIQAMVMIKNDSVAVKETLNSSLLRRLTKELRDTCVSVSLKPFDKSQVENEFQGEAIFKSGGKIQLFAHEKLGWRPAHDLETLRFLTKRQMERDLYSFADTIQTFSLDKTAADTVYTGKLETRKGDKKEFFVTWSQTGFRWELNKTQQ